MENIQSPPRRWPLFFLGALLFLLGPVGYAVQMKLARLDMMPWYVLALAGGGLVLMIASVWQRGSIARGIGLAFFLLLGVFEGLFLLVLTKTPDYQGPVHAGSKFPAFNATFADGRPFTNADLDDGKPTALLFFRGRW